MLVNTSIHDCMDAGGRATQESKPSKQLFWLDSGRSLCWYVV